MSTTFKNRTIFLLVLVAVGFNSCNDADDKVPGIATDMCQCFSSTEKNLAPQTKEIFLKASNAADPKKVLIEEIAKLDEAAQLLVSNDLLVFSEIENPNSAIGKCMAAIKKKYGKANAFNETRFAKKIIKELESKRGCAFTSYIMKVGMTVEENEKE